MRTFLTVLFAGILALMIGVTTWASLDRSVFDAGDLFADRWFVATFCDAYCGFVTFYVWVAYRESSIVARLIWFVAIMALGNIAVALYLLIAIWRLKATDSWDRLLLGSVSSEAR
jgi:uncharacterized protein DUF1475